MTKLNACPVCGSKVLQEKHGRNRFPFNDGVKTHFVWVGNLNWQECADCGESFYDDQATSLIQLTQTRGSGLLSPDELRELRKEMGLSQVAMAQILGIGAKSYFRWEKGVSIQNRAMDNYIRLRAKYFREKKSAIGELPKPAASQQILNTPESLRERFPYWRPGDTEYMTRAAEAMPANERDCFVFSMVDRTDLVH